MQGTLADGQLGTSAAEIYSGTARCVGVVLQNTSASTTQTVVLTFTRAGGTSRRLVRQVLLPNEQCIVRGIPIEPSDSLLGSTSNATTVDYVVFQSSGDFTVEAFDANGALKQVNGTTISGAVSAASLAVTGGITSSGPTGTGIGYATGAGGTVTQATSRTTGVTLSKLVGQITTHTASLAAGASAKFTVTNTTVAATDAIIVNVTPGGTGTPVAFAENIGTGSFDIRVYNIHASTADTSADVINFAVLKGVAA